MLRKQKKHASDEIPKAKVMVDAWSEVNGKVSHQTGRVEVLETGLRAGAS